MGKPKQVQPTHFCPSCGWAGKPRCRAGFEPQCARCGQTAEVIYDVAAVAQALAADRKGSPR